MSDSQTGGSYDRSVLDPDRALSHAFGLSTGLAIGGGGGLLNPLWSELSVIAAFIIGVLAYLTHRSLHTDSDHIK